MKEHEFKIKVLDLLKWLMVLIGSVLVIIKVFIGTVYLDVHALYFCGAAIIVLITNFIASTDSKKKHDYDSWGWHIFHSLNIAIYAISMFAIFLINNTRLEIIILLAGLVAITLDVAMGMIRLMVLDMKTTYLLHILRIISRFEKENKALEQKIAISKKKE